jgi:hypothetical protein
MQSDHMLITNTHEDISRGCLCYVIFHFTASKVSLLNILRFARWPGSSAYHSYMPLTWVNWLFLVVMDIQSSD